MEELITITQLNNLSSAYLLKSMLEAQDIKCYLTDENMSHLLPFSTGGIKIQVGFKDSFKALEIFYEFNRDSEDQTMI